MKQFFTIILFCISIFFPVLALALENVVEHDLQVRINPQKHQIHVEDKITLPENASREIIFSLHTELDISSLDKNIKLIPLKKTNGSIYQQFKLQLPQQLNSFTLHYDGIIFHPLEGYGKEQSRGFRSTPGLISTDGVYLAGGTHWFPQFEEYPYLSFKMSIESPEGWKTVSQGKKTKTSTKEVTVESWDSQSPQEEIYLIAAPFTEYRQSSDNIEAQVFLREPDQKLAQKYLDATVEYISMYEKLLGPYPYAKFALVENFWETGFGMPSFTLLGSKVIRLPFILNSSYPHEILHNWWGNGVYVDFDSGNWSEGLTAYLADHLIKEQQGQAANYRLQSLQKYSDYAAKGRDFPLTQFRGRHSSASEAVGYGKTLMLFNMLRLQLGDQQFKQALKQFYKKHQFKITSFEDLKNSFEQVSEQPLDMFFQQWTERTGAPKLNWGQSKVFKQGKNYRLQFTLKQIQSGEPYQLQVPIAVTLEGNKKAQQSLITLTHRQQQFVMDFPSKPVRVDIDPEFDLFRKLAIEETPAAFTQLFGSHEMLVILPRAANPTLKAAWINFARDLSKMGPDSVTIKWDDELKELPDNLAITVLGWENHFAGQMTSSLESQGASFNSESINIGQSQLSLRNHSIALVNRFHNKEHFPRAFIATDVVKALPGLGRKLPHYHKYSYLAFEGDEPQNKLKGRWSVNNSPMTLLFDKDVQRAELEKRSALAETESQFDSKKMKQTIKFLTNKSLQGRGFGSAGLDKSANYIAEKFALAGLKPAGDTPTSYFQSWLEKGGDPQQETQLKNIIGLIPGIHPTLKHQAVVIGAHYDHLGLGWPDVRDGNKGEIHSGADDNASGVSVLIELARISGRKMKPDRTIIFAAFSAEEAGRKGSRHYITHQKKFPADKTIGMLNLDTVGRLGNKKVQVLGANSASEWPHIFRGIGFVTGIQSTMINEDLDSSDQVSFHEAGVPAVQLFSGVNLDYHRPGDTADKIDSAGLVKIANISHEVIQYLAARELPLSSNLLTGTSGKVSQSVKQRKVSLGSIPDFTFEGDGYRLDGVVPGSPAENAGLKKADIIQKVDGAEIHGLRDISIALKSKQAGQAISITYRRQGKLLTTRATLQVK